MSHSQSSRPIHPHRVHRFHGPLVNRETERRSVCVSTNDAVGVLLSVYIIPKYPLDSKPVAS